MLAPAGKQWRKLGVELHAATTKAVTYTCHVANGKHLAAMWAQAASAMSAMSKVNSLAIAAALSLDTPQWMRTHPVHLEGFR